ncbi:hypothetical protein LTR54_017574 [Friedmanniomyces endolithicus]|nr:hypothetical protein LTR54_017574 [Friedmanniomyces endolithicus]
MTEAAITFAANKAASPHDGENLDLTTISESVDEYLELVRDFVREAIVNISVYDTGLDTSEMASLVGPQFVEPQKLYKDNFTTRTAYGALSNGLTQDYLTLLEDDNGNLLHNGDLSPSITSPQQSIETDVVSFDTAHKSFALATGYPESTTTQLSMSPSPAAASVTPLPTANHQVVPSLSMEMDELFNTDSDSGSEPNDTTTPKHDSRRDPLTAISTRKRIVCGVRDHRRDFDTASLIGRAKKQKRICRTISHPSNEINPEKDAEVRRCAEVLID